MKLTRAILLILVAAAPIGAQSWINGFDYPNGTKIGAWQEYVGNWTCSSTRAFSQDRARMQHLVQPKIVQRDCAVQCVVFPRSNFLQYAGPSLRVNNPGSGLFGSDLIRMSVRDSDSDGRWDFYVLDEHLSNGVLNILRSGNLPTITPRAVVRLTALDQRLVGEIDCDGDGKWDVSVSAKTTLTAKPGPVGVSGYSRIAVDDFRFYDAVILHDASATKPSIGTEFRMVLRGPAGAPYVAASSFGNYGVVLSSTSAIPLSPDILLAVTARNQLPTIFRGFVGTLDTNGDGRLSIRIPRTGGLVGVTLFTAFVNFRAGQVLAISNDFQFTVKS